MMKLLLFYLEEDELVATLWPFSKRFCFRVRKGPDSQEFQRTKPGQNLSFSDLILSQGYMIISTWNAQNTKNKTESEVQEV